MAVDPEEDGAGAGVDSLHLYVEWGARKSTAVCRMTGSGPPGQKSSAGHLNRKLFICQILYASARRRAQHCSRRYAGTNRY